MGEHNEHIYGVGVMLVTLARILKPQEEWEGRCQYQPNLILYFTPQNGWSVLWEKHGIRYQTRLSKDMRFATRLYASRLSR